MSNHLLLLFLNINTYFHFKIRVIFPAYGFVCINGIVSWSPNRLTKRFCVVCSERVERIYNTLYSAAYFVRTVVYGREIFYQCNIYLSTVYLLNQNKYSVKWYTKVYILQFFACDFINYLVVYSLKSSCFFGTTIGFRNSSSKFKALMKAHQSISFPATGSRSEANHSSVWNFN